MKLFIRLEAPFEWVRVNAAKVEAFGEVANINEYPLSEDYAVIGVVPGEWVTCHDVTLPAKSRKQFNAALPYALEEAISEDVENMHFSCQKWKVGEASTVMVVAKQKMQYWQALANDNRLPVEQLLPDYALLPFHDSADYSLALSDQQILSNRRNGQGVSLDPDLIDVWIMDVPIGATVAVNEQDLTERLIAEHPDRDFRHWPFGSKMAHWLDYTSSFDVNLWSEQYRPKVGNTAWRAFALSAAVFVAALLGVLIYDAYRYFSLHNEIKSIHQESASLLRQHFPELDSVEPSTERAFMERAIVNQGGVGQANSVQAMLADIASVLRRQNVTIADIIFRDSQLIITCLLNDFSQVDRITRQLNARPRLSAILQSSSNKEGSIKADYVIKAI